MRDPSLSFLASFPSGIQPFAARAPQVPYGPRGPHHQGQKERKERDHQDARRHGSCPVQLGVNVPAAFVVAPVRAVVQQGKGQVRGPVRCRLRNITKQPFEREIP